MLMVRKKVLFACLVLLAAAPFVPEVRALAAPAAQDAQSAPATVEDLLKKLRNDTDRAEPKLIQDLAAIGSREALEALLDVYNVMSTIFMKREVVRVLPRFDGVAEAEQPALQKLMDVATQAQESELREAALEGLGTCEAHGQDFLAMIVKSPAEDAVREKAMTLHVKLSSKDDHAWYRELYKPKVDEKAEKEREKAEREEKKKERKKKGAKDDEEKDVKKPRRLVNLDTIRAMAFRAIADSMEAKELHEAAGDRYHKIREAALEELSLRNDEKVVAIATDAFEKLDGRPETRVFAARILAKHEGKKVAPEFIKRCSNVDTPIEVRRGVAEILAGFDDPAVNKEMIDLLQQKARGPERLFQMYTVRGLKDERVDKAYIKLLQDKEEDIVIAATKLLGERKTVDALPLLKKIYEKNKDKDISRAAMRATAMIRQGDTDWVDELLVLTKSEDPEMRNMALQELGNVADKAHLEKLVAALDDPAWSVRLAALEALEHLRMKEAISAIILRMQKEEGRMLDEFANTLWRLTGQPYADLAEGWANWWEGAKENFVILSDADLQKVATGAEEWRLRQTTRVDSKFFGIRIISHRVIFVIDVSGSMDEGLANDYQGKSGQTRMEVARTEIMRCIKGLDPGALFNVIDFSSDVNRWVDGSLAAANEKNRAEALAYCEKFKAFGGTNTYGAIKEAFADPDVDTIFFLSDGEPSVGDVLEPSLIREHVKSWNENRGVVINTIQVGGQFDILQWLAEDSGGTFVKFE